MDTDASRRSLEMVVAATHSCRLCRWDVSIPTLGEYAHYYIFRGIFSRVVR